MRTFANKLGVSDSAYDKASEIIPFVTSVGTMVASVATPFLAAKAAVKSGVRSGAAGSLEVAETMVSEEAAQSSTRTSVNMTRPTGYNRVTLKKLGCFFVAGTLIITEDGEKPIEEIQIGDKVLSQNVETGEKGYKEVKRLYIKEIDTLVHLKINGEEIDTTENHPFWVVGIGWIAAGNLRVGDKVLLKTGEISTVESITVEKLDKPVKVYNFEVEDWHTYFVAESGILCS